MLKAIEISPVCEILPRASSDNDGILVLRLRSAWCGKKVPTLENFLHFVDAEFDFSSFVDVVSVCARDVITGLEFLHRRGIAHRDLKPGYTLDSNQCHFPYLDLQTKRVKTRHQFMPAKTENN